MSSKRAARTSAAQSCTAAGSRAKTSADLVERVAASMASVLAFGVNLPDSSGKGAPSGLSSRTPHCSSNEGSPLCSGTLPRSGTCRGGIVYLLAPSALLTSATASSSSRGWPTPTALYWASTDPALTLRRWQGDGSDARGRKAPSASELVEALHGRRVNLTWLDCLMGFPPDHSRR